MDITWTIGDVIAKLRAMRRMNQTTLAKKVGVNKATIVRAEDGDPKVSRATYLRIAEALGTELVDLEVEAARLVAKGAPRSVTAVRGRFPEPANGTDGPGNGEG